MNPCWVLITNFVCLPYIDKCWLSNDIYDYNFVSQGKTIIPGVDDAEEMHICDVRTWADRYKKKSTKKKNY